MWVSAGLRMSRTWPKVFVLLTREVHSRLSLDTHSSTSESSSFKLQEGCRPHFVPIIGIVSKSSIEGCVAPFVGFSEGPSAGLDIASVVTSLKMLSRAFIIWLIMQTCSGGLLSLDEQLRLAMLLI